MRQTVNLIQALTEHPSCKSSDLTDHIHISRSTLNRILKQLRDEGLIQYSGSKKTGGYWVKEVATKTPISNKKVKKRENTQPL